VTLDSIDLTLWLASIVMESVLIAMVVWKRVYRKLPIFFCFLIWCLASDAGMAVAHLFPSAYLPATLANITVDALFQLAILARVGKGCCALQPRCAAEQAGHCFAYGTGLRSGWVTEQMDHPYSTPDH
jgi:hypothetical protein